MSEGMVWVGFVLALAPIEGADKIESATAVCGRGGKWMGVVPKGQFREGDPCFVYLPDSIVPQSPDLAFMEKYKWRVRVMRFRGTPSECLIMPLTVAGSVGDDVTRMLGVTKYEKPLPAGFKTEIVGKFPYWIPKTDEPHFQSVPEMLDALRGKPWYATIKYDGMSTTAYKKDGHFGLCSRNWEMKPADNNVMWQLARRYKVEEVLPEGYAIQWETFGPAIQGNPLGITKPDMRVFNVWDISNARYLDYAEGLMLCDDMGLPFVEECARGKSFDMNADDLRAMSVGVYPNGEQREGIVIRPMDEITVMLGSQPARCSCKVVNPLYRED